METRKSPRLLFQKRVITELSRQKTKRLRPGRPSKQAASMPNSVEESPAELLLGIQNPRLDMAGLLKTIDQESKQTTPSEDTPADSSTVEQFSTFFNDNDIINKKLLSNEVTAFQANTNRKNLDYSALKGVYDFTASDAKQSLASFISSSYSIFSNINEMLSFLEKKSKVKDTEDNNYILLIANALVNFKNCVKKATVFTHPFTTEKDIMHRFKLLCQFKWEDFNRDLYNALDVLQMSDAKTKYTCILFQLKRLQNLTYDAAKNNLNDFFIRPYSSLGNDDVNPQPKAVVMGEERGGTPGSLHNPAAFFTPARPEEPPSSLLALAAASSSQPETSENSGAERKSPHL